MPGMEDSERETMDELIRKQDALDVLMAERKHLLANGQKGAEHILTHHGYNVIEELDVPDTNVGDMISRQAAIDSVNRALDRETLLNRLVRKVAIDAIRIVPPVQPKRGKWIPYSQFYPEVNTHWIKWECSECGYARTKGWEGTTDGRCPTATICENCGADMRGEAE